MVEEYIKIGEFKVKEIFNNDGKKIQDILAEVFKNYCKEEMEKNY